MSEKIPSSEEIPESLLEFDQWVGDRNRKDDIEVYETARFFTVTGDHVEGTPIEIHSRSGALDAVYEEYLVSDTKSLSAGVESGPP